VTSEEETQITYDEFSKVRLKIGKVIHAEPIPGKNKVIVVGAAPYFSPDQFVGRIVVICTNLIARRIGSILQMGCCLLLKELTGILHF